ncbi:MAG: histidine phosphatase family protein [Candidatus Taylorbacteria bacterium]|nr:histidine phosphatase family protein [Candidatus Taylorbacteria bacterium]
MNRPALLVLVRHALSLRNETKGRNTYFPDDESRLPVQGIPDHKTPLTDFGLKQALKTGVGLRERFGTFDYIYHSGYLRTIQTMNSILKAYTLEEREKMRIRMNHFVRERHAGYAYDMTTQEAELNFPWLKEYWQTFGGFFATPPGGESLELFSSGIYLFLNMLFRDRAGEKVLVNTHGGTLRCFRFLLEHWNYDQAEKWPSGQSPKNCGVTVYQYDSSQKRLVLQEYNTVYWEDSK